jgi:hypothetical protein
MEDFMGIIRGVSRTAVALGVIVLAGCSTTQQAPSVKPSGFLRDYTGLRPGQDDQALLVYKKANVDWSTYTKVMIEPVAIYAKATSNLSSDTRGEQAALATYFYATLREHLGKNFTVVNTPGPGVLRIRTAVSDADQSEVLLDTVSTVMPIGLAVSTLKRITFGSDTGVGFAQAEVEILDSESYNRLFAAVDKRYGTKAIRSKFGSWNHAQEAMDYWASTMTEKLVALGAGRK